jgi:hypothetical protein
VLPTTPPTHDKRKYQNTPSGIYSLNREGGSGY